MNARARTRLLLATDPSYRSSYSYSGWKCVNRISGGRNISSNSFMTLLWASFSESVCFCQMRVYTPKVSPVSCSFLYLERKSMHLFVGLMRVLSRRKRNQNFLISCPKHWRRWTKIIDMARVCTPVGITSTPAGPGHNTINEAHSYHTYK